MSCNSIQEAISNPKSLAERLANWDPRVALFLMAGGLIPKDFLMTFQFASGEEGKEDERLLSTKARCDYLVLQLSYTLRMPRYQLGNANRPVNYAAFVQMPDMSLVLDIEGCPQYEMTDHVEPLELAADASTFNNSSFCKRPFVLQDVDTLKGRLRLDRAFSTDLGEIPMKVILVTHGILMKCNHFNDMTVDLACSELSSRYGIHVNKNLLHKNLWDGDELAMAKSQGGRAQDSLRRPHPCPRHTVEVQSKSSSPLLQGIGSDAYGSRGIDYLEVPAAPTPDPQHRYLGMLCSVAVPEGMIGELVSIKQGILLAAEYRATPESELEIVTCEQTSIYWSPPDGNVTWYICWVAGGGHPRTSPPEPLLQENYSSDPQYDGTAWLATQVTPYIPLNGGMPPGDPFVQMATINHLGWPITESGKRRSRGQMVTGPGLIQLVVSVRQTNPARDRGPRGNSPLVPSLPEDIFLKNNPTGRYFGVSGGLVVNLKANKNYVPKSRRRRSSVFAIKKVTPEPVAVESRPIAVASGPKLSLDEVAAQAAWFNIADQYWHDKNFAKLIPGTMQEDERQSALKNGALWFHKLTGRLLSADMTPVADGQEESPSTVDPSKDSSP